MPRKQPAASPALEPIVDIPECPPEGLVLAVLGGVAALLPRSLRDLGPEAASVAGMLQLLADQRDDVADRIDGAVAAARQRGLSWSAIGWCLGVTGEGARKAFSDSA